jgi:hypothetical protein
MVTGHEDQNDTLKPDRQRLEGVQQESPRPVKARFPLVIISSGTPHPHQPERKLTRKPGRGIITALVPVGWGYQSVTAAARSRDGDPLT